MKKCYLCQKLLPTASYYANRSKKDGMATECKSCNKVKNSKRYYKYREKYLLEMKENYQKRKHLVSKANKNRRKSDPDYFKNNKLRSEFGIGLIEYRALSQTQKYRCAICGSKETVIDKRTGQPRSLAVDHCHKTDKVRGLLCMGCNQGIGNMKESVEILSSASKYLLRHKKEGDCLKL